MKGVLTASLVAILLAASCVWVADAVAAGRGSANIRQSGLSKEEEILPDFMIRPFGDVYFTWNMRKDADRNTILVGTWNFTNNVWVAIGIKSDKRMRGPLIVCYLDQVTSSAVCDDYVSKEMPQPPYRAIEFAPKAQALTNATNASFADKTVDGEVKTVISISFSRIVARLGESDDAADIDMLSAHRVIFAKGGWDKTDGTPKQHHTDNTDTALINFITGKVENLSSGFWKIALGINCGVALFLIIVIKIIRVVGVAISHTVRNVMGIVFCVLYLAMVFGFIYARYKDYLVQIEPKAFPRSFGDGAAFCLASLMMPVSKRILFPDLLSVSYPRAIKYHMYIAFLFIACTSFHGAGMIYYYDFGYVVRWRDKDKVSRLPGLLTYLICLFIIPLALLRFKIGYRMFRWSHYAYILVAFLSVCHYPMLAIYCTPGLSLLVLSFLHKRLATPVDEAETIKSLSYDKDANAITLEFVKDDAADPGRWYFLSILDISRSETHPFAVCKLDQDRRQRFIKFVIRPTPNPKGWTQGLQKIAESGKLPSRYKLDGPHSSHQVQARAYSHLLLICGGMGITGHNHFLDQCLDDNDEVWMETKKSITLLWVVREPDLLKLFAGDLGIFKKQMAQRFFDVQCTVKVFLTKPISSGTAAAQASIAKHAGDIVISDTGRPNYGEEFADLNTKLGERSSENVATYVSGPAGFQDSVGKALGSSPMKHHIDYECYSI